jgi:hypothetical protein
VKRDFPRGAPYLEGCTTLFQVFKPVVDGSNAPNRAADVIKHLVDDVWGNVQPRHASAAKISTPFIPIYREEAAVNTRILGYGENGRETGNN